MQSAESLTKLSDSPRGRPLDLSIRAILEHAPGSAVVALTFEPRENGTELTLHHTGVPDDEMGRQHAVGWTWILSMLTERFASGTSAALEIGIGRER
jgi:hypothetical protein